MALFDRKMQVVIVKPSPLDKPLIVTYKSAICLSCSVESCPPECGYVPSDGPFFTPPPSPVTSDHNYHMPFYFILMLCIIGASFGFILYMVMLRRYRSNSRNRTSVPQVNENREDYIDENVGPVVDHPIWYIRTIGLPQEIIDSIAVFRYKKDESLIEGTDCSVCLTEFEEDESLRLLPKCSHAFHVPCIDTWLRSHKNCPLCRAPIVTNMDIPQINNAEASIINIVESSPNDEVNLVENARHDDDQLEDLELVEEGNHETRRGVANVDDALPNDEERMMDLLMKIPRLLDEKKKGVRVFSDLAEHRGKVNKELQPARRSVSMDCSAAQMIHLAMNEMNLGKSNEECGSSSDDQLAEGTKGSLDVTMSKRENRNLSLYKAIKSSSFGRSLQKVPVCMKRSFSTSGKSVLPTTSRIQDLRQTL